MSRKEIEDYITINLLDLLKQHDRTWDMTLSEIDEFVDKITTYVLKSK